jgi:hypothetical protein
MKVICSSRDPRHLEDQPVILRLQNSSFVAEEIALEAKGNIMTFDEIDDHEDWHKPSYSEHESD